MARAKLCTISRQVIWTKAKIRLPPQRELLEETGHVADDWQHLASVLLGPNRSAERTHLFLARGVRQARLTLSLRWRAFCWHWML